MTTEKGDNMTIDMKRLRELAEDAKHDGSWWESDELGEVLVDINGSVEEIDAAKFIAATDPQTVLTLLDELEGHRRWKAEAVDVLLEWEKTWEAAGCPGRIGTSKAESVRQEIDRLRALADTT